MYMKLIISLNCEKNPSQINLKSMGFRVR